VCVCVCVCVCTCAANLDRPHPEAGETKEMKQAVAGPSKQWTGVEVLLW
jgi:hypothetical protein